MSSVSEFIVNKAIESFYRKPEDPGRIYATGKKLIAVYAVIAKNLLLLRTEGPGDINALPLWMKSETVREIVVPVIHPQKIEAKLRRRMLEILRGSLNEKIDNEIKKYKQLGFERVDNWNCRVMPPFETKGSSDLGMCGFCPSCNILGTIIDPSILSGISTSYGIKKRVDHDIAYALVRQEKSTIKATHTKVGDAPSYTGKSIYDETHVVPGTVFVGKIVLRDLTMLETKLVLSALTSISRIGGGETNYGSVSISILGMTTSNGDEITSSHDIASAVVAETRGEPMEPLELVSIIRRKVRELGFTIFNIGKVQISVDEIHTLWSIDNYSFSKSIVDTIARIEPKKGKGKRKQAEEEESEEESE